MDVRFGLYSSYLLTRPGSPSQVLFPNLGAASVLRRRLQALFVSFRLIRLCIRPIPWLIAGHYPSHRQGWDGGVGRETAHSLTATLYRQRPPCARRHQALAAAWHRGLHGRPCECDCRSTRLPDSSLPAECAAFAFLLQQAQLAVEHINMMLHTCHMCMRMLCAVVACLGRTKYPTGFYNT